MIEPAPLRLAFLGCGARGQTYASLMARRPRCYTIVAAADPDPVRRARIRECSGRAGFLEFTDDRALFAQPRCADVLAVGTQDAQHRDHAIAGMEAGYDLLLEKPIATTRDDTVAVVDCAKRLGRRVLVCHVMRYTPFYRRLKSIIDSGALGGIISVNATEGVGAWHQAHSYVRGAWAVGGRAAPMILAKSCHDLDILRWLIGRPCERVSSEGRLTHFRPENAPAGAPARCTDGCPVAQTCHYNAHRYAGDMRRWAVYASNHTAATPPEMIIEWLKTSPWGRCAYRCDNTAVDHQTVQMGFAGGITATFTMTAFENGRHIEIFGARGRLRAGEFVQRTTGSDIILNGLDGQGEKRWKIEEPKDGYAGHGGGDPGLVDAISREMTVPNPANMHSSIEVSLESHLMAFAAEEARLTGSVVRLAAASDRDPGEPGLCPQGPSTGSGP